MFFRTYEIYRDRVKLFPSFMAADLLNLEKEVPLATPIYGDGGPPINRLPPGAKSKFRD